MRGTNLKKPSPLCPMKSSGYAASVRKKERGSKPDDGIPLVSLEHLLLDCPALNQTRNTSKKMWASYVADKPALINSNTYRFRGFCIVGAKHGILAGLNLPSSNHQSLTDTWSGYLFFISLSYPNMVPFQTYEKEKASETS